MVDSQSCSVGNRARIVGKIRGADVIWSSVTSLILNIGQMEVLLG